MPNIPIPDRFTGKFNTAQTAQLLAAIKPARVMRAQGHSHLSQQDVIAHLIRVFGYGNWCTEMVSLEQVFEQVRPESQTGEVTISDTVHQRADNPQLWKYDVAYRCVMRLIIFDEHHNPVCSYEDGSMGDSMNQTRADGHDLAMKTAISTAIKRCAKNLGDQFGLSLYNKGQMNALVGGTHVKPEAPTEAAADLQEGVDQQVSLGDDEIDKTPDATAEQEAMLAASLGATRVGVEPPEEPNPDHTETVQA